VRPDIAAIAIFDDWFSLSIADALMAVGVITICAAVVWICEVTGGSLSITEAHRIIFVTAFIRICSLVVFVLTLTERAAVKFAGITAVITSLFIDWVNLSLADTSMIIRIVFTAIFFTKRSSLFLANTDVYVRPARKVAASVIFNVASLLAVAVTFVAIGEFFVLTALAINEVDLALTSFISGVLGQITAVVAWLVFDDR